MYGRRRMGWGGAVETFPPRIGGLWMIDLNITNSRRWLCRGRDRGDAICARDDEFVTFSLINVELVFIYVTRLGDSRLSNCLCYGYCDCLCYGYCATSQGCLDWFEVDRSARPASSFRVSCVLSIFTLSSCSPPVYYGRLALPPLCSGSACRVRPE